MMRPLFPSAEAEGEEGAGLASAEHGWLMLSSFVAICTLVLIDNSTEGQCGRQALPAESREAANPSSPDRARVYNGGLS
jgi:hypothetical protein